MTSTFPSHAIPVRFSTLLPYLPIPDLYLHKEDFYA